MKFSHAFGFALIALISPLLGADDIQMLPTRLKLDSSKSREGTATSVESKEIAYSVKVTNRAFKELPGVVVKYNIFYQNAELGSTAKPETLVAAGSHVFSTLASNKAVEFQTDPIKLEKTSLDRGWYFASGAAGQARDKVVGVWLKAFDAAGKQIGEYANPSTVTTKQKWKD